MYSYPQMWRGYRFLARRAYLNAKLVGQRRARNERRARVGEPQAAWTEALDERQRKEVDLARTYAARFAHGTDGHNRLMLIAKLAEMLDAVHGKPLDG